MSSQSRSRPNIVLIMSDQHNPHVMGCSGDSVVQTPHLDALAAEGIHCTSTYCAYPLCVPSRMAFMTGQYASEIGVWHNPSILRSDIPTFAHAFGASGYEAVLCGRMHFNGPDQFHGFESRIYGDCSNFISREIAGSGNNRTTGQRKYAVEVSGYGRAGYSQFDERVTTRACDFLASRDPADRPFCLVVGYMLPHNPLICDKVLFERYLNRLPVPESPISDLGELPLPIRKWWERRGVQDLTPEQHHRALAAYYGLVTELDRNVGRVVRAVRESLAASNTVVVYCSDHGDSASEHGMWWKSNYFEGSARVPAIFSWPARLPSGSTLHAVCSLIDFGPTLLELAGAEPMSDVSGKSFGRLLFEPSASADTWPNEIFCEYIGAHGDKPSCMVRSGPWKLMYYSEFDSYLLFNLNEDPGELRDRAADPSCKAPADHLLDKIHRRWSARRMLNGYAKERRAQDLMRRCGHPPIPHALQHDSPAEDANQFDFSQVPNWEAIKSRAAREGNLPDTSS